MLNQLLKQPNLWRRRNKIILFFSLNICLIFLGKENYRYRKKNIFWIDLLWIWQKLMDQSLCTHTQDQPCTWYPIYVIYFDIYQLWNNFSDSPPPLSLNSWLDILKLASFPVDFQMFWSRTMLILNKGGQTNANKKPKNYISIHPVYRKNMIFCRL